MTSPDRSGEIFVGRSDHDQLAEAFSRAGARSLETMLMLK